MQILQYSFQKLNNKVFSFSSTGIRFLVCHIVENIYLCTVSTISLNNSIDIYNLRSGNHDTYEMLFTEWYVPLCNYAYSILRDQDEAKDIVQKTFYTLWDQRTGINIHTSVKSYLYRIVHNNCLNKIKQHKIRSEHNQYIAYETNSSTNNTENSLIQSELQMQIEAAIEKLPPRCKEVFRMSRFGQLSYAEISKELNITTNTVETQIVKALRILRTELKDYLPLILLFYIISGMER